MELNVLFSFNYYYFYYLSSIPALVNFASIRDNISLIDENKINSISPLCSTDLVLDHAIVDVAKK